MLKLEIRKARADDAQAVHTLRNRAIRAQSRGFYTDEAIALWTAGEIASNRFGQAVAQSFYVAELDGRVQACGAVDAASGKLDAIFVDPAHMRKGLGSAMLRHLEQIAVTHAISVLHLEATLNAVVFYSRSGFVRVRDCQYQSPRGFALDCVVMHKQV